MELVRLHLFDAEALEEVTEATDIIGAAGGQSVMERMLILRDVFNANRSVGRHETLPMGRIPGLGELVCLPAEEDVWYRVEIVLHTPGNPSYLAEIWAMELAEVWAMETINST